jgi:hypothetical protein
MSTLSDKIHDCPMPLTNLDVFLSKGHSSARSESASEQKGDHGQVTRTTKVLTI